MGSVYVLDFSDGAMSSFFAEELNVDIDDVAHQDLRSSKAKHLHCFLNEVC